MIFGLTINFHTLSHLGLFILCLLGFVFVIPLFWLLFTRPRTFFRNVPVVYKSLLLFLTRTFSLRQLCSAGIMRPLHWFWTTVLNRFICQFCFEDILVKGTSRGALTLSRLCNRAHTGNLNGAIVVLLAGLAYVVFLLAN